jgi:hypothetical protein
MKDLLIADDTRLAGRLLVPLICPIRDQLLNAYSEATRAYSNAVGELCALVDAEVYGSFCSMTKVTERSAARCATARKQYETHKRDHRCS